MAKTLIVGKWYKNPSNWDTEADFCKARIKSTKNNWIYFSESIDNGTYKKEKDSWGEADSCIEATPEEYSKYLPDGHSDKVVTLEKGKWYRFDDFWQMKFKEVRKGEIYASEYIDDEGEYFGEESNLCEVSDNVEFELITDLKEVSEFLPDGHPDKIVTLEKDCWYEMVGKNYFIKFDNLEGGKIVATEEYINNGKHMKTKGHFGTLGTYTLRLITDLSEISKFLPDGHPDKLSEPKVQPKVDTKIKLNESHVNKFLSFKIGSLFYKKARLISENGRYFLVNNCHGNYDGHSNKKDYRYSWVFDDFESPNNQLQDIKILDEEPTVISTSTKSLSIFPSEGYCMTTDIRLSRYLAARPNQRAPKSGGASVIGIAWNPTSCWWIATTSGKTCYSLAELEPFLTGVSTLVKEEPAPTSDVFVVGKKLAELKLVNVGIEAYKDGEGKEGYGSYHNLNYEGHETILKVTKDFFEVSGFCYGWFKKSEAIGVEPLVISDYFVTDAPLSNLPLIDKSIQCYKDGQGKGKYNEKYNLLKNFSNEKIKRVTDKYFEVSGFCYGWFKKSEAIGVEPSTPSKPAYVIDKLPKGEYFYVKTIGEDWDRITIGTGTKIIGDIIRIPNKEFLFERPSAFWASGEYEIRPATELEIEWMDTCRKNTAFIPFNRVTDVLSLIKTASEKFPIGSKFHPAKLTGTNCTSYVVNNNFRVSEYCDTIYSLTDDNNIYSESCSKYGNHSHPRIVYSIGTWASHEKIELVGRYVKAVVSSPEGGSVRAGEYGKIITENSNGDLTVDFPFHSAYYISNGNVFKTKWYEIMPIGWVPEAVELTSLPKKWCIKVTEENRTELGKWRTDGLLSSTLTGYLSTPCNGKNGYHTQKKGDEFTEITTEQFREWVKKEEPAPKVKEQPKLEEWSVGTYGVLLNDYQGYKIGLVDVILASNGKRIQFAKFLSYEPSNLSYCNAQFKWFATIEEANAFAKTLISPEIIIEGLVIRPNNIYTFTMNDGSEWIVDISSISSSKFIYRNYSLTNGEFNSNKGGSWGTTHNVTSARYATKSDLFWLEACKKAGKFVEKPEIWCVQVTDENRDAIKTFMVNEDWQFNTGSYYGFSATGKKEGSRYHSDFNSNVISTEDFYKKIGHVRTLIDLSGSMSNPCAEVDLVQPKSFTSMGLGLYTLLETSRSFPIYIETPPIKTKANEIIELKLIQPRKLKINLVG